MDGVVGDAELVGILVLARFAVNDAEAVAANVGFKAGRGSPDVGADIADALNQALNGDNIGRWAAEELNINKARSRVLPQ